MVTMILSQSQNFLVDHQKGTQYLIMFHLCKILNTKPHLIEYKNSGDITNDKIHGVVGYASFWF